MAESKLPAKSDRKSHRRTPGDPTRGSNFHRPDRSRVKKTGQLDVLMTPGTRHHPDAEAD